MPEVVQPEQSASEQVAPFQILSDMATDAEQYDHLRFARYADALAFLIDQKETATPLIMAISAPWGAGKTTLANLVEEQLRESILSAGLMPGSMMMPKTLAPPSLPMSPTALIAIAMYGTKCGRLCLPPC